MEIVGYCIIKKNATTGTGCKDQSKFVGQTCRVMDFAEDGGVLVMNHQGTEIATFDREDVARSFKCKEFSDVICPADMSSFEQLIYVAKCQSRKGGYNHILKNMVIARSLMKGKFDESFLWAMQ